jgi:hypothetical protein
MSGTVRQQRLGNPGMPQTGMLLKPELSTSVEPLSAMMYTALPLRPTLDGRKVAQGCAARNLALFAV